MKAFVDHLLSAMPYEQAALVFLVQNIVVFAHPMQTSPTRSPKRATQGAAICALFIALGCDSSATGTATPHASSAPTATATVPTTSAPTTTPSASAAPTSSAAATTRPTVAALRRAAADDPAAFEGEAITLEAFFVQTTRKQFGTGEFPRHSFARVDVALEAFEGDTPGPDATVACTYPERAWPPLDLKPGDPIVIEGRWSTAQLLAGGWRPGGGALHVAACSVRKAD